MQQKQEWNAERDFYCKGIYSACIESNLHVNGTSLLWGRHSSLMLLHLDAIKCDGYYNVFLIFLQQLYMLLLRKSQTNQPIQNKNFNRSHEEIKSVWGIIKLFHTVRSNQEGKQQGASIFQTGIKLEPFTTKIENWTTAAFSCFIHKWVS